MQRDYEMVTIDKITELVDLKDKDVLEVGCGSGWFTGLLAGEAGKYNAIDPDVDALEQAQKNNPVADFMLGSGENLPFDDESFDVVLFTLSLHHQNAGIALTEAERVLRKSGKVLVMEPAHDGQTQRIFNLFNDETEALIKAVDSVKASGLKLKHKEVLVTLWNFEDFEEMIEFDFGWKGRIPEEVAERKMRSELGEKAARQPIVIEDKLQYFVLEK